MEKRIALKWLAAKFRALIRLMKDKNAPKRYKAVVIFGIIYLVWPLDLIPAPILGLCIIDDAVIWAVIIAYLNGPLSKYEGKGSDDADSSKASNVRTRKHKRKTVIDVDDFEIVNEKEEKRNE